MRIVHRTNALAKQRLWQRTSLYDEAISPARA